MSKKTQDKLSAGQERVLKIAQGVNMAFCWCPPGDFIMGSPESEEGRFYVKNYPESNVREEQVNVTLTRGFWMAKTQVTQLQWTCIRGFNLSHLRGDDLPVDTVNIIDIQKFLDKLNSKVGNLYGGKIALPTEAQWEYACRAGEKGPYSGGSIDDVAWYEYNSDGKTHPVGLKLPNAWGLHDMHGNVYELCSDFWHEHLQGGIDPAGPTEGWDSVYRGGSWGSDQYECRSASRNCCGATYRHNYRGFRPVLVPFEEEVN
jgi:formylglycine-generating enzyme required for sulfatase activity